MANLMPKVFYGLHFVAGVAEYSGPDDRIYISEETAKSMDASFSGKPVYTRHLDKAEITPDSVQNDADGYVVESFFNKNDGKHWVKFIVVSDDAQEKIKEGWKLSNGYTVTKDAAGGKNHNVEYKYEVVGADYTHLAIVPVPRYEESIILTPEEFKEYNERKSKEIANSLEQKKNSNQKKESVFMKFKFFAKKEIENSQDVSEAVVTLKNGKEVSVAQMVEILNAMDDEEEKKKKEAKEKEEKEKEDMEKKNADEEAAKKKKEEEDKEEKKKKEEGEKEKLNEIKNAMDAVVKPASIDLAHNKLARGKKLYGSNTK